MRQNALIYDTLSGYQQIMEQINLLYVDTLAKIFWKQNYSAVTVKRLDTPTRWDSLTL